MGGDVSKGQNPESNTPPSDMSPLSIPALGKLEVAVLECIWAEGELSAKEAHDTVGAQRGIALNTVQSAMERLYRKGLLSRVKASHAYRYSASVARPQLLANLINDVLGRFGNDSASSVAAIVDAAEQFDKETLALIEAEIKNRRERGA